MSGLRFALLGFVFFSAACAPQWSVRTDSSGAQFIWPVLPEKPRIKYVSSITGFEEGGPSLKAFFLGSLRADLMRPVAVAVGSDGRLAVADTGLRCVHLYIPSEKKYIAIADAGSAALLSPVGIAFDEYLRLFVTDSSLGRVSVYDKSGKYIFSFSGQEFGRPTGLAYNWNRKLLYVVDTLACKVFALNTDGKLLFSFGERGDKDGQFNFPTHVAWSPAGQVYVTDAMNFRVQIFDESGGFRTSFGHHGDGSGDFAMPKGVAADSEGTLYVVDSLFDNVQLFKEKGEFLLTLGRRGYEHGEFWLPSGIVFENGKIYISDTYNRRVQVFDIIHEETE